MTNTRRFSVAVIVVVVFVVLLSYYRFFLLKDYLIYAKIPCNPLKENCFQHECDLDDVRCNNLEDGILDYKILEKKQKNIINCTSDDCIDLDCVEGDDSCEIYFCSDENIALFELNDSCVDNEQ